MLLHGFPTWSFDWAPVAEDLSEGHEVITLDFLGYGASDKPRGHDFSVAESVDTVEQLLRHLGIDHAGLVVHGYGGIVGQELLDRRGRADLSFDIDAVHLLNSGVVYHAYRPALIQRLLISPAIGPTISCLIGKSALRRSLDAVGGERPLSDQETDGLWLGISRDGGHRLMHRHIRYNAERAVHHRRWLDALVRYEGPLDLIWGPADPVSGDHVLTVLRELLPQDTVRALQGVGHFPQSEAPERVAHEIRHFVP